jgi:hypothetical protein
MLLPFLVIFRPSSKIKNTFAFDVLNNGITVLHLVWYMMLIFLLSAVIIKNVTMYMILKYLLALKLRIVFHVPEDFAVGDML